MKSPACRRISIRVHPADGVKVVIPGSLSYDEGLRFFLLKRDWVVSTIARQRERAEKARRDGKTLPLLCNGTAVKTLMSEIVFVRRDEGAAARHGLREGGGGEVPVSVAVTPVEDVRQTGRTWLSLERPLFRKEVVYPGSLPEEGSPGLDSLLRQVLVDILRKEARLVLPQKVAFFADRFGGYTSFPMRGALEFSPEYEFENARYSFGNAAVSRTISPVFTQYTGGLTWKAAFALSGLLKSDFIYHKVNGSWKRIVIESADARFQTVDSLHYGSFSFRYSEEMTI